MTSFLHASLPFGALDEVLLSQSDKTNKPITVCIFKSTVLQNKDRVACQVFDGGTAYEMPINGVAFGVRLVMRSQAMDLLKIKDGLIISLGPDTIIHTLKSGEKVFDCYHAEIVDDWKEMKTTITNVLNNPLSKAGAPREPVYHPAASANTGTQQPKVSQPPPDPPGPTGGYGPERSTRPPPNRTDKEPYAPVKVKPAAKYLKVSDLTSYVDKWRILARVTFKSDIREYRNARGEGKLFSIDLIDLDGVEIKGTFFNEAVDRFFPIVKKGCVYSFSKGQIKPVNPRFKKFEHLYELTFGLDAEIQPADETMEGDDDSRREGGDTRVIPLTSINPTPLSEVEHLPAESLIDVIGFCYHTYEVSQIVVRATGNRKDKRTILILDQESVSVPLTLWGADCQLLPPGVWTRPMAPSPDGQPCRGSTSTWHYYLVVKKAKVDDFNGRNLTSSMGSVQVYIFNESTQQWSSRSMESENVSPNLIPPQAIALKDWYAKKGTGLTVRKIGGGRRGGTINSYHSIADMLKECQIASNEKLISGSYFNVVASVVETNITAHRKFYWAACPQCGKKMSGGPDASGEAFGNEVVPFSCANCELTVNKPDRKYNFSLDIQDSTETVRLSVLGDCGRELFDGRTANDLEDLKTRRGPQGEEFTDVIQSLRRQEFLFKLCARSETWQDETKIKYRLVGVEKLTGETLDSYVQSQKIIIDTALAAT